MPAAAERSPSAIALITRRGDALYNPFLSGPITGCRKVVVKTDSLDKEGIHVEPSLFYIRRAETNSKDEIFDTL